MSEQNSDSSLKEYEKLVNGQSLEWLEKELHLWKTQLTAIENLDPEEEQKSYEGMLAQFEYLEPRETAKDIYAGWDVESIEKAATEADDKCKEDMIKLAAMDPLDRTLMQAKGLADLAPPSLLTMRAEMKRRIRILERAINAQLDQEFSKGEAAGAQKLPRPPANRRWPKYPRSKIKRAILAVLQMQIRNKLDFSDEEICRRMCIGQVDRSSKWSKGGTLRLYTDVLADSNLGQNVHSEISRVRTDLRKLGWKIPYRRGPAPH